ncbi:MAG: GNAT family N-acetyltransferase [Bacillota bacterium]|nr:GNAT family N-acetyltransferase [Bacillota bacterium]
MEYDIKDLYRIKEEDYDRLYDMLLEAFRNYEKLLGAYPDRDDRQAAIEMVIAYYLAYDFKFGGAYSLDDEMNDALVICHSDVMDYSEEKRQEANCENDRFRAAAAGLSDEQIDFWFSFFEEFDRQEAALEIPEPHIYVDYVAVREDLQGQGRGSRIITKLKEYADGLGFPIMLFTNGERDVKFYLKNGFRVLGVTESEEYRFENTYMLYEPYAGADR